MKAYKPKNIKQHNQDLLIELLKKNGLPMTKKQLAEQSHLSVVTINKLIPELVENHYFIELDTPFETGGRYAVAYQFNERRKLFLVNQFIEYEKNIQINFYIVDLLGTIIAKKTSPLIELDTFLQTISELKIKFPEIALVVNGITGVEVGNRLKIMDFKPFKNLNLNQAIKTKMEIASLIENDINAATLGYSSEKAAILAGIYFPENFLPGASLVIQQQIFKGGNNLSGEIQHLPNMNHKMFPLKETEINRTLIEAVQSVIAMYDPHEIVVYLPKNWLNDSRRELIVTSLTKIFPYDVFPKITFSPDFSQNYLQGLIKLGIAHLAKENNDLPQ